MLQSSGLGNSLNAITSLLLPYQIPVLTVISMRGDAGEWNAAQVPMGRAAGAILDAMGVPRQTVTSADAGRQHRPASRPDRVRDAGDGRVPVAAIGDRAGAAAGAEAMTRLDATRILLRALEASPATPIVASLGHPAYDLFAAGDRPANFYTWGSMGLASSIGLGLALARPDLRVFVLDGDGSLLMNLGSLATIGWAKPESLVVVVLGQRGIRHDRRPGDGDRTWRRPRRRRDGARRRARGDGAHG